MLGYLLSKPANWEIQSADIEREGEIGSDARRTLMKEAEIAGYLTFHTERNSRGQTTSYYELHEIPVAEQDRTRQPDEFTKCRSTRFGSTKSGSTKSGQPAPLEKKEVQNREIEKKEVVGTEEPTTTTTPPETPVSVYAAIGGKMLSIGEQELIEGAIPEAETQAFKNFLTGWRATYGMKTVFKVLEAYRDHRDKQAAHAKSQRQPINLGVTEADLEHLADTLGAIPNPVVIGAGADRVGGVDADTGGERNTDRPAPWADEVNARVEAFTRARKASNTGSRHPLPPPETGGTGMELPF